MLTKLLRYLKLFILSTFSSLNDQLPSCNQQYYLSIKFTHLVKNFRDSNKPMKLFYPLRRRMIKSEKKKSIFISGRNLASQKLVSLFPSFWCLLSFLRPPFTFTANSLYHIKIILRRRIPTGPILRIAQKTGDLPRIKTLIRKDAFIIPFFPCSCNM